MTAPGGDGAEPAVLEHVRSDLAHRFGPADATATVSFVGVEPIDVVRFGPQQGLVVYATVGMARHPMSDSSIIVPNATWATTTDAEDAVGPNSVRGELILRTRKHRDGIHRQLAVLAAAPTVEGVVYRAGGTVDLDQPLGRGSTCTGALLDDSNLDPIVWPGGAVRIFQLTPATPTELRWCRLHGVSALREGWRIAGTDLLDLARDAVALG